MQLIMFCNFKQFCTVEIWTVETITWNACKETLTETCALDVEKWKIFWIFIDYLGKKNFYKLFATGE